MTTQPKPFSRQRAATLLNDLAFACFVTATTLTAILVASLFDRRPESLGVTLGATIGVVAVSAIVMLTVPHPQNHLEE